MLVWKLYRLSLCLSLSYLAIVSLAIVSPLSLLLHMSMSFFLSFPYFFPTDEEQRTVRKFSVNKFSCVDLIMSNSSIELPSKLESYVH